MPSDLERSILHTACWFGVHGMPATSFELWKWLWFPVRTYRLDEVMTALAGSAWLAARLQTDGAFYAVRAEEPLADMGVRREDRFVDAIRKYGALRRAAGYFRLLPLVEAVAAANTLSWWQTKPDSDIDLFIIARPGCVWLARLCVVAPFAALGRRPGIVHRDPFCFSFFTSANRLSLKDIRLFGGDPYLAYWTRSLVPILDRTSALGRFQAANAWTEEMLPHAAPRQPHPLLARADRHEGLPLRRPSWFLMRLERMARFIQLRRLPSALRDRANHDSSVIVSDERLKFHENDRRERFRDRFQELVMTYEA